MEYMYQDDNWRHLDLDLVRHSSEAQIVFVLPVSIEDRLLLWMVVRS